MNKLYTRDSESASRWYWNQSRTATYPVVTELTPVSSATGRQNTPPTIDAAVPPLVSHRLPLEATSLGRTTVAGALYLERFPGHSSGRSLGGGDLRAMTMDFSMFNDFNDPLWMDLNWLNGASLPIPPNPHNDYMNDLGPV